MPPAIYHDPDLVSWYPLIDPPADHAEEAACYLDAFARGIDGARATLLDLGSGGGHNARHLKAHYACTLVDVAEPMLALSRAGNPECEHVAGDIRSVRVGRTFDAVLVHDAVTYMVSEDELRAAIETAFVHTRPGGAALFTPDDLAETFEDRAELIEHAEGPRALKYIEWQWDPVPGDGRCRVEFMLLLREGGEVRAVHDRHEHGLFPRATWIRLLTEAGFEVEPIRRPIGDGETDEVFLCRRPRA